jgi:hypothetical protein
LISMIDFVFCCSVCVHSTLWCGQRRVLGRWLAEDR